MFLKKNISKEKEKHVKEEEPVQEFPRERRAALKRKKAFIKGQRRTGSRGRTGLFFRKAMISKRKERTFKRNTCVLQRKKNTALRGRRRSCEPCTWWKRNYIGLIF
jgi:hypothetical protein